MKYGSETKKDELLTDTATWRNLKDTMLSERSQVQKDYTLFRKRQIYRKRKQTRFLELRGRRRKTTSRHKGYS